MRRSFLFVAAAVKAPFRLAYGLTADIATLGGAVNDGWFRNGHCTYTTQAVRSIARDAVQVIQGKEGK